MTTGGIGTNPVPWRRRLARLMRPDSRATLRCLAVLLIAVLALGLRLEFGLRHSHIVPIHDAAKYWRLGGEMHAWIVGAPSPLFPIATAAFTQNGILPFLIGLLLYFFPATPWTVGIAHAVLDSIVSVMVVHTARRLGLPTWASLLAGLLYATYIPGIIGSAAVLQQPLLRFAMTATLWAYTSALATRRPWPWIWLGTILCLAASFSTLMTRPLIWIVPALVILAGSRGVRASAVMRAQCAASVAVGVALLLVVIGARAPGTSVAQRARLAFTGFPSSNEVPYTVSVLSFPEFWPPDDAAAFRKGLNPSLVAQVLSDPLASLCRVVRSVFENWRFPDNLYFQRFLLDRSAMNLQHALLVCSGLAGIAWLVGCRGHSRQWAFIVLGMLCYLSLVYGLVSVEPRRIGVVIPIMCIGAASCAAAIGRSSARLIRMPAVLMSCLVLVADVVLPWQALIGAGPGSPDDVHRLWLCLWLASITMLCLAVVASWKAVDRLDAGVTGAILLSVVALIGFGRLTEERWREFVQASAAMEQRLERPPTSGRGWRWLLVDLDEPGSAGRLEIRVDGDLLKDCGAEMWRWIPGAPFRSGSYDAFVRMSNGGAVIRTWHAYPMHSTAQEPARDQTIALRACDGTIAIRGDFLRPDGGYEGPLFEPWGTSIFRWIWSGEEPRYPVLRPGPPRSESRAVDGRPTRLLERRGLLRVFVVELPFGPSSNVATRGQASEATAPDCPRGSLSAHLANPDLKVCRGEGGQFKFFGPGSVFMGAAQGSAFTDAGRSAPTVVVRFEGADFQVQVEQVLGTLAFAHFYGRDGEFLGSVAFLTNV
jgi:hypothetical protein